jgi:prepilin-type N-terminal cleavage/methylation domain-containing protein
MKTYHTKHRGFTLVELLVVVVIIAALAGLALPQVMKYRKKADLTQAQSNVRQIGMALLEFETAYSGYPDSSTVQQVIDNTGTQLNLAGDSANAYFRQLLATEVANSEEIFFAKTAYTKKPDNIKTSAKALEPGEVGFGYIMNGNFQPTGSADGSALDRPTGERIGNNKALSSSGDSSRPILVAPLAFPFQNGQFDPDFYDANAVVLRLDNSVQSLPIVKTTKLAVMPGGKNLLQTGEDTIWGTSGVTPTIVNPEPKQ